MQQGKVKEVVEEDTENGGGAGNGPAAASYPPSPSISDALSALDHSRVAVAVAGHTAQLRSRPQYTRALTRRPASFHASSQLHHHQQQQQQSSETMDV